MMSGVGTVVYLWEPGGPVTTPGPRRAKVSHLVILILILELFSMQVLPSQRSEHLLRPRLASQASDSESPNTVSQAAIQHVKS